MSKPKWQRLCVAVAGPAMNVLTALAIPTGLAMMHHEVPAYLDKPAVVKAVEPNSPSERVGLQTGDLIVKIDGRENPNWRDIEDTVAVNPDSHCSAYDQARRRTQAVQLARQESRDRSGEDRLRRFQA